MTEVIPVASLRERFGRSVSGQPARDAQSVAYLPKAVPRAHRSPACHRAARVFDSP